MNQEIYYWLLILDFLIFANILDRVKEEHEKFLLSLETPMRIPKEKITRWHPEFDVEKCPPIELGELPEAPNAEKSHSAQEVLGKSKTYVNKPFSFQLVIQSIQQSMKIKIGAIFVLRH